MCVNVNWFMLLIVLLVQKGFVATAAEGNIGNIKQPLKKLKLKNHDFPNSEKKSIA